MQIEMHGTDSMEVRSASAFNWASKRFSLSDPTTSRLQLEINSTENIMEFKYTETEL